MKTKIKKQSAILLMYGFTILNPFFITFNSSAQDSCKTVITGNTAVCKGESTTLTAFTALQYTGYTYQWNTGGTTDNITVNMSADSAVYWVAVSNGSCTDTAFATVKETTPTARIVGDTVICKGESTTLTAECGTNYVWNTGEKTAAITVSPANSTTYTVTTCGVNAYANVTVNICVGVGLNDQYQASSIQFQVYPNPSDGNFELRFTNYDLRFSNAEIRIYNVLGEKVYQQTLNRKQETLNTKLSKGVYFLQLTTDEGVWNEKIIVNY